jgi:hypothetical protein
VRSRGQEALRRTLSPVSLAYQAHRAHEGRRSESSRRRVSEGRLSYPAGDVPDFHLRDSGGSGMSLRCRTDGLDPIPSNAFLASINHRFWTGARRRPAISRWVACGWRFRPKVFLVVLCDFNRLSEVAWLEVLAVNSHGGSSPPPRTTEPLGNKGGFVVWPLGRGGCGHLLRSRFPGR